MRLGISTACFYPLPLEEAVDRIAALGFDLIEIFFNTESEYEPAFLDLLSDRLRAHGISVVSIHPYTSLMEGMLLFSQYDRRTEDGLRQYRRYLAAGRRLGARYLTLHGERSMARETGPEDLERRCAVYRRLCAAAAEEGMTIAQENVAWCKSKEPAYLRALYENVPELRYTLDIKQAGRAGHDWREYLDVMGDRLVNVHINDWSEQANCLLPGQGDMDYQSFYRALRAAGYNGQTLIEVYSENYTADRELTDAADVLRRAMWLE